VYICFTKKISGRITMRRFAIVSATIALVLPATSPEPAHALVGSFWTFGFSLISETVGVTGTVVGGAAVAGTGAAIAIGSSGGVGTATGEVIAVGGAAIAVLDPPTGTFYDGSWTITYPRGLFVAGAYGWRGDWGGIPGDLAPPVSSPFLPEGTQFVIQPPNPGLTTTTINDAILGEETTTFDWGPAGHVVTESGAFNMYAAEFIPMQSVFIDYIGSSSGNTPMAGANFYITSPGITCRLSDGILSKFCGERVTEYFRVKQIPEPSTWAMMLVGFAGLALAGYRKAHNIRV
jgi:hypothetical protein